jgi:hypothetical protein
MMVGQTVSVKWQDVWYIGRVLEIGGKKNNLVKVKDDISGNVILLDNSQFKVTAPTLCDEMSCGTEVVFYDSCLCTWITGTIQQMGVEVAALVHWQKDPTSSASVNWFEANDISLASPNEANDYESIGGSLRHINIHPPHIIVKPADETTTQLINSPYHVSKHHTSTSMKKYYSSSFNNNKISDDKLDAYLKQQASLLHGRLDHSSFPPAWSYAFGHSSNKGIPYHPASKFFQNVARLKQMQRAKSDKINPISLSPSVQSKASEPTPYAQVLFPPNTTTITKATSVMSDRPLPPLPSGNSDFSSPYEVPISLSSPPSMCNVTKKVDEPDSKIITYVELAHEDKSTAKVPVITSTSKNEMTVSAGGIVTLHCEATSDTPLTYEWTKDGDMLTHNDERVAFPSHDSLQLYGICMSDKGLYQCNVTNHNGTSTYTCKLDVEEETIKKSFSREYGLNKFQDLLGIDDDMSPSNSLEQVNDDFQSQAPSYASSLMVGRHRSLTSMLEVEKANATTTSNKKQKKKSIQKRSKSLTSAFTRKIRKNKKEKKRRNSNTLSDEMNNYLEGYGEDYGRNDVMILKKMEISNNKKKRKKIKSSKVEPPGSATDDNILPVDDELIHLTAVDDDMTHDDDGLIIIANPSTGTDDLHQPTDAPTTLPVAVTPIEHDINDDDTAETLTATSIDVLHYSYGSSSQEDDDDDDDAHQDNIANTNIVSSDDERLSLPVETQHYTEAVRRLQISAQEYEEELFGKASKKHSSSGGLSKIFTKSSSKQTTS